MLYLTFMEKNAIAYSRKKDASMEKRDDAQIFVNP